MRKITDLEKKFHMCRCARILYLYKTLQDHSPLLESPSSQLEPSPSPRPCGLMEQVELGGVQGSGLAVATPPGRAAELGSGLGYRASNRVRVPPKAFPYRCPSGWFWPCAVGRGSLPGEDGAGDTSHSARRRCLRASKVIKVLPKSGSVRCFFMKLH